VSVVDDPLLSQALAWVDAALLAHHHAHPVEGTDIPGVARSRSVVEHALRPSASPTSAGESGVGRVAERAVDAAADAARELRVTLARVDVAHGRLATLYRTLGLAPIELQALVVCLAPEIDAKYQTVYGVLHDDLGRRAATLGLICALLGEPRASRSALTQLGALARWRLVEGAGGLPYADDPLRLDTAVLAWLLGKDAALGEDPRLHGVLRRAPWAGAAWLSPPLAERHRAGLETWLSSLSDGRWLALAGADGDWWQAEVEAAASRLAIPLVRVELAAVERQDALDLEDAGVRIARAAQLTGATPVVHADDARPEAWTRLLAELATTTRAPVMIACEPQRWIDGWSSRRGGVCRRPPVDAAARGTALVAAAREQGLVVPAATAEHAMAAYPLTLDAIDHAVRSAALESAWGTPEDQAHALVGACRRVAAPGITRFARRFEPTFRLDDVVLPHDRHAQLEEIVAHVEHASTVLRRWGFGDKLPYGRGVTALFSGPSGTGKTMAVQAIAHRLRREVFCVDLSQCVSKYIGESEKNLDVVFGDAERAGAVLHFEEADAIFGRRSEVKDAHDRYANIEVAYLLQRMEAYSGLAILTTNFRQNLDSAFLRRLRFVIEFAKPDAAAREEIWKKSLPADAPVADDVDVRFLARRFELTGGHIRQITLRAAFVAAQEERSAIAMHHLVHATRAELLKLGMPSAERELAELASVRWSVPRAA
jgi:hypothetical protein